MFLADLIEIARALTTVYEILDIAWQDHGARESALGDMNPVVARAPADRT